ncbi:MAG: glycosyltransferase family 39 protein [Bdellovibrionales bacterium]|nr:glycosyltransferase family 39 protein [Bdellovibrionales bacterium]
MHKDLILFWWIALFIKIIVATFLPLFNDEAYYWIWSHHLQLSYYDHPPFIAWLYYLGQPFENFYNLVRLPAIILGHCSLWIWLIIAKDIIDKKYLTWFLVLSLFMPFIGPASLIATPDLPLLFFWPLSLLFILKISKGQAPWYYYSLLGLSLGLGFCSKYTMVLTAPIFFAAGYMTGIKKFMQNFRNAMNLTLFFILGSLPVFWWNFMNEFASFRFQVNHGIGAKNWNPEWTLTYLIAQMLIVTPLIIFYALKTQQKQTSVKLIKWAAWVPLCFFLFTSFKGRVEANWPIMAHPAVLLLAFTYKEVSILKLKWLLFFWMSLFASIYIHFFFNYLPIEKLAEYKLYKPIEKVVDNYHPLYARTFQMASQMSFQTKKFIYKLKGMNRIDFFDHLEGSQPTQRVFYVAVTNDDRLPEEWQLIGYKITETIKIDKQFEIWKVEK